MGNIGVRWAIYEAPVQLKFPRKEHSKSFQIHNLDGIVYEESSAQLERKVVVNRL